MLYKKIWPSIILIVVIFIFIGCSPKEPIVEQNKQVQKKVKNYQIGILLSKMNNNNENEKVVKGISRAAKKYTDIKTKIIKPGDFVDAEEGLRYLAENSYDLVIAVGDEEAKVTNRIAKEYADVSFAIINVPTYSPNLASLQFKDEEGVFLAGALSGLLTKSNKVAFVGGLEKMPEKKYQKAYKQGVAYINKQNNENIEVITEYTGNNWDAEKVNNSVKNLSDQGVDIFFNGYGRNQEDVILAAAANKKHAIGFGENQRVTAPGKVYSSVVDNLDSLIYRFIIGTKIKGFKGGNQYFGLSGNGVSLLDYDKLTDDEKILLDKTHKNNAVNLNAIEGIKKYYTPDIYEKIKLIQDNIKTGKIKIN